MDGVDGFDMHPLADDPLPIALFELGEPLFQPV